MGAQFPVVEFHNAIWIRNKPVFFKPLIFTKGGLTSSNLLTRFFIFSRKGGVGIKGDCLERGGDSSL